MFYYFAALCNLNTSIWPGMSCECTTWPDLGDPDLTLVPSGCECGHTEDSSSALLCTPSGTWEGSWPGILVIWMGKKPASTRLGTDIAFMFSYMLVGHVEITWWNMLKCLVFSTSELDSREYFHVRFMLPGCQIFHITIQCYVSQSDVKKN